jgi:hypothetical protein
MYDTLISLPYKLPLSFPPLNKNYWLFEISNCHNKNYPLYLLTRNFIQFYLIRNLILSNHITTNPSPSIPCARVEWSKRWNLWYMSWKSHTNSGPEFFLQNFLMAIGLEGAKKEKKITSIKFANFFFLSFAHIRTWCISHKCEDGGKEESLNNIKSRHV